MNEKITADIERFKEDHKIEIKCISDRILLYLRWGADKVGLTNLTRMLDLYYKVRGDPKYTSKNPRSVAAAILYICTKKTYNQWTIGKLYSVSDTTIRYMHHEIQRDFK